ncbi:MAG: helix-hairpin-helix domain-containing protein [Nitrospira sp.]|nr:helix-hairpin-helix domain-containing protein [Nitrospira sp.]
MVQSLLIKLAMLAAAVALVFWIGWPMPDEPELEPEGEEKAQGPSPPPQVQLPPRSDIGTGTIQPGGESPRFGWQAKNSSRLDLNRATADDLEQLPGIGPVLARRIVEWRRGHGAFSNVDDLNHVKGIGEKKLRQLKPLVMVGQSKPPVPSRFRPAAAHEKGPEAP